jgi:hypothetical protein
MKRLFLPSVRSRVGIGACLGESGFDGGTRNDFLEAEAEVEELSLGFKAATYDGQIQVESNLPFLNCPCFEFRNKYLESARPRHNWMISTHQVGIIFLCLSSN